MPPSVVIADPEPFFREALAEALEATGAVTVVGVTGDQRDAERLCGSRSAQVVLSEVTLAAGSGIELTRRLAGVSRVVILTREHPGDVLIDAVAAGAAGCSGHDAGVEDIVSLIQRATAGGFAVDPDRVPDAIRRIASSREAGPGRADVSALTGREREVLRLLSAGLDNDAIAKRLYVSAHTIRTHVGRVLRKLGAHSRAEAARLALSSDEAQARMNISRIRGPELNREMKRR